MQEGLTFDDVTLVPQFSRVASRHDVDLACGSHFELKLRTPILSANMRTVSGTQMCDAMQEVGALGVMHRFQNLEDFESPNEHFIASIGVDNYKERLEKYKELCIELVCIDVAHGDHQKVISLIKFIKDKYGAQFKIVAGNVCTARGAYNLYHYGADVIKVGVGPGSHCTTRLVTGHGVPQITAIQQAREAIGPSTGIIADGGIRDSGDIAKALAAGADYVMLGRLLAGCEEAPSELVNTPEGLRKVYRGSASYEEQSRTRDKHTIIAEGVQSLVPYVGHVGGIIQKLSNGLKSACSYSGVDTLAEFKKKAILMRVTNASFVEGTPHGVR